jgi:uncharacterized protein (DUF2147 family)
MMGAAEGDAILGLWNNEEKDARIEILRSGDKYYGRIVWVKEPTYPVNDKAGRTARPRTDDKNPDPLSRNRPILGLKIMYDFTYAGSKRWKGGKVYDPKSGNTYRGTITLVSADELYLRGFVLFSLFGRTTTWTRADR